MLSFGTPLYLIALYGLIRFFAKPNKKYKKNAVNWGPFESVGITLVLYFSTQLIAGLGLYVFGSLQGWSSTRLSSWADNSAIAQFLFVTLVEGLTVLLLYNYIKRRGANFKVLGLVKPQLRDLAYALSGFAVYFILYVASFTVITRIFPSLNVDQPQQLGFDGAHGLQLVLVFVSLVLLPPLVEEILIRGFLYGGLRGNFGKPLSDEETVSGAEKVIKPEKVSSNTASHIHSFLFRNPITPLPKNTLHAHSKKRMPVIWAALITSGLFAVAHLQAGSGQPLLWIAAIDTFVLSLVLVALREKTGSLWASIGLHMLKNGIAFVALFVIGH